MLCGETFLSRSLVVYSSVCLEAVFIFTYLASLQALYQIAVLIIFNFDGKRILSLQNKSWEHAEKIKNTFVFNAFVFCQVSWSLSNLKFQL